MVFGIRCFLSYVCSLSFTRLYSGASTNCYGQGSLKGSKNITVVLEAIINEEIWVRGCR